LVTSDILLVTYNEFILIVELPDVDISKQLFSFILPHNDSKLSYESKAVKTLILFVLEEANITGAVV